jgi:integrase
MPDYRLFKRARKKETVSWLYYWRDGRRIFKSTGETELRAAEREADKIMSKIKAYVGTDPSLEDYCKGFFVPGECAWVAGQRAAGHAISDVVAHSRRRHLDQHILPRFGKLKMSEINGVAVERWLLSKDWSNQSRNHVLYSTNVCRRFAVKAGHFRETQVFTMEELGLLFPKDDDAMYKLWKGDFWCAFMLTTASCGLRPQETRALQWRHVLWDEKALAVVQAVKEGGSIGEPKANEKRLVLLPARTLRVLEHWHDKTPTPAVEHWVFPGPDLARPITGRNATVQLQRVLAPKALDLRPGRTLRSFRHGYNTMLRRQLPPDILRALTGHRDDAMSGRYDHPTDEAKLARLEDYRNAIETALPWGEPRADKPTGAARGRKRKA